MSTTNNTINKILDDVRALKGVPFMEQKEFLKNFKNAGNIADKVNIIGKYTLGKSGLMTIVERLNNSIGLDFEDESAADKFLQIIYVGAINKFNAHSFDVAEATTASAKLAKVVHELCYSYIKEKAKASDEEYKNFVEDVFSMVNGDSLTTETEVQPSSNNSNAESVVEEKVVVSEKEEADDAQATSESVEDKPTEEEVKEEDTSKKKEETLEMIDKVIKDDLKFKSTKEFMSKHLDANALRRKKKITSRVDADTVILNFVKFFRDVNDKGKGLEFADALINGGRFRVSGVQDVDGRDFVVLRNNKMMLQVNALPYEDHGQTVVFKIKDGGALKYFAYNKAEIGYVNLTPEEAKANFTAA